MKVAPLLRRGPLNEALHELRRPAQRLSLLIEARLGDDDRARACLDSLAAGLALMDEAINGAGPSPRSRFNAADLLADAAARWGGVAVSGEAAATLAGDRTALGRALDNLIANAVTHGTGPVELSSSAEGGEVRIDVRDGGPRERRAAAAPGDPRHGHGLRIAAALAADHGGAISEPRPEGAGTVASLRLPVSRGLP